MYPHTKGQVKHFHATEKRNSQNMKVFPEKTTSFFKNDKLTKTSIFFRFLMKSCILPIKITEQTIKCFLSFFQQKCWFTSLAFLYSPRAHAMD